MNVSYKMVVDFARPSKTNSIVVSEGDTNSRRCEFTLLFNKQPFEMIDVSVATIKAVKQNGSVIYDDATITIDEDGNKLNEVSYIIPGAMTDEAGKVVMTVTLLSTKGEQITSFEFYFVVRNALYNEDDYISEEDLSGFRDLYNRSMAALEKMEVMTQKDALPNPYPFNLEVEGVKHSYSGSETVDVKLGNMAYILEEEKPVEESIDETSASKAAKSALEAKESADRADNSAQIAVLQEALVRTAVTDCEKYKDLAFGYQGQAAASARLAEQTAQQFSKDIEDIKQAIRDLGGNI